MPEPPKRLSTAWLYRNRLCIERAGSRQATGRRRRGDDKRAAEAARSIAVDKTCVCDAEGRIGRAGNPGGIVGRTSNWSLAKGVP